GVLGSTLAFADTPRQVIGVLPPDVSYPIMLGPPPQAYIPYVPTATERDPNGRRIGTIMIVGRLRPDVTIEQARADANRLAPAVVVPLHDQVVGPAGES